MRKKSALFLEVLIGTILVWGILFSIYKICLELKGESRDIGRVVIDSNTGEELEIWLNPTPRGTTD